MIAAIGLASMLTQSQDIGTPDPNLLTRIYPGKAYSPYADPSFPSNVYWSETHLHTGLSLDAFNYYTHEQQPDGSVEVVNLDMNLYYRFCNTFLFGVFYHKNHHDKPNLFNPMRLGATDN